MGNVKMLLGFEKGTGNEIYMNLHHTVITGMSQLSGKTTTLEAMISRSDRRAIAFKTKRGESGFNNYNDVPPFFIERADWQYVSSLLEAVLREKMRFERPWIMKATKGTNSLKEVLANVQSLKAEATKQLSENVYTALEEYLKIVVPQIEKFSFSRTLNAGNGISVMDLTEMSPELQGLVIQSTMEYVITNQHNTIIIIPEAWEHLPQGRNTPVKLYAETFIRKGAAIGNFLFIDSQDIAGVDKTPLRQCNNWILGRQREGHEVERVREAVGKNRVTAEDIRGLQIGHFIAILGDDVKKVYVLPAGVPSEVGKAIAKGELPISEAKKYMTMESKMEKKVKETSLLPPPYEQIISKVDEFELKLTQRDREINLIHTEVEEFKKKLEEVIICFESIKKRVDSVQNTSRTDVPITDSSFTVDDLNQIIDQRMNQIIRYDKPTMFTQVNISERLRELIRERYVKEASAKIRALPRGAMHTAMVIREMKSIRRPELFAFLRGGDVRVTEDFYAEIGALETIGLITYNKETGMVQWSLGEYLKRKLSNLYDESVVNQVEEYLTSLLLPS